MLRPHRDRPPRPPRPGLLCGPPVSRGLGAVEILPPWYVCSREAAFSVPSGACRRARTWSSLPASIRADHLGQAPNAACAASDSCKLQERPHLKVRFGIRTKPRAGHAPPVGILLRATCFPRIFFCSSLPALLRAAYFTFNSAPSGITPWSKYRQRAISSFRATATIPTRRERRLPGP